MAKTEKLLAVLDLPEKEQKDWLWNHKLIHEEESLADLAFRLRDEISNTKDLAEIFDPTDISVAYFDAFMDIAEHYKYEWCENEKDVYCWIVYNAKPIHWIIAALIAKELAEEKE